jgi:hypothetical protein
MATTLYDKDGNMIINHDLQDKAHWCQDGESKEQAFVRRYGADLGYAMNPEKAYNEFAPDLVSVPTNMITDLKSQHCPFFKAGEFYGIDPTYAVVFNLKDRQRYEREYPGIDILYYVDWTAVRGDINGVTHTVAPLTGIYRVSFRDLLPVLDKARIHNYGQRRHDTMGNAKSSYVIDIRNPAFERLL